MSVMKYFLLLFVLVISGCENLLDKAGSNNCQFCSSMGELTPPELRDAPLKEIRFFMMYKPKYTEEKKKEAMVNREYCFINDPDRNRQRVCKYLKHIFEKDYIDFQIKAYCYDIKPHKESIFRKNLKARLYDKEGNVLAEDYLRCDRNLDGLETCHKRTYPYLNFYLPYSKKAYKVQVIKQEEEKEIILNEKELLSYEEIKESRDYFKRSNCHSMYARPM